MHALFSENEHHRNHHPFGVYILNVHVHVQGFFDNEYICFIQMSILNSFLDYYRLIY